MSRKGICCFILMVMLIILSGCSGNGSDQDTTEKVELVISAAASLVDSMTEIHNIYESKNRHITLTLNYGSSGTLEQQIQQGAPVDLFISAGKQQMTTLHNQGLISGVPQTIITNELVIITPSKSPIALSTLEELKDQDIAILAIGEPEVVPAGGYAKEALKHYELWKDLNSKIVFAKDVRQVLSYVETGNADVGFVYRTDALSTTKVKIAWTLDPTSHKRIEYPAGIVKSTHHFNDARKFLQYLQGDEAQQIFKKYGFTVVQ